ncbi:MAG TPA: exosortase A [Noviherbaspirillum sp.]
MKRDLDTANPPAVFPGVRHDGAHGAMVVGVMLAIVATWVIAWYFPTATEIGRIWWRSDTYAHGLIVLPVFGWLVWHARERLVHLRPRPVALLALPIVLAGVLWGLGRLVGVAAASHFAVVAILVLSFIGVLGWKISHVLCFPLAFLMFAAPIGDFLLPTLMNLTATFTVYALRLSGVPVYREGLYFVVPNGSWSVVEACSGIRYLIASVTVGAIYAYIRFSSLRRRLLFMVAALVVPIVANWLRAYMIVMLGYLTDNRLAAGVDHLIYGWVFFGVVMLLLFAIAARWREPVPALSVPETGPAAVSQGGLTWWGVVPVVIAICAVPLAEKALIRPVEDYAVTFALPAPGPGWTSGNSARIDYRPRYHGSRGEGLAVYDAAPDSHPVAAYVAWYADQRDGREMVGWRNGFIEPGQPGYRVIEERDAESPLGPIREAELATPRGRMRVWRLYWVNGRIVSGDVAVKTRLAIDRLLKGADDSAVIILATPADDSGEQAAARLKKFLADHAAGFEGVLDTLARGGGA